ncbi:MAG: DUF2335 domain-containing protein [Candidatus Lambdaproteobacteria bacterium]|nr:DUF2335 domain-containing protein [Candidatus Lambdaproteobacteria bacterium]
MADEPAHLPKREQQVTIRAEFSGFLPPPQFLEQYERTLPGAAERIFRIAEQEQRHAHEMRAAELEADIRDSRLGQWLGFGIGVACLITSGWLGYLGLEWASAIVGPFGITGLVSVFVWGRKKAQPSPGTPP